MMLLVNILDVFSYSAQSFIHVYSMYTLRHVALATLAEAIKMAPTDLVKSIHCNSLEYWVTIDEMCRYTIFNEQ